MIAGGGMVGIRRHSFFALRLLAGLLLLSCITPAPGALNGKRSSLASAISSVAGQPRLVIGKSRYTVTLYKGERPVKTYPAVFGKGYADGDKQMQGDRRTPEGDFYICTMNDSKRFHKFMGLSYPDMKHADAGLRSEMISPDEYAMIKKAIEERLMPPWDTRLGGAVGIHGRMQETGSALQIVGENWTDGCIALDNTDIDEIYTVVSLGTPVTILP